MINRFQKLLKISELELSALDDFLNRVFGDKLKNVIIATGGGAVTNKQNMVHLKENGTVFCLNRAKELIAFDNSRPLCQNSEAFDKLYQERKNLYQEYADYQINNDRAIEDAAKEIVAIYEKTISN